MIIFNINAVDLDGIMKKLIPYLLLYVFVAIILGITLGAVYGDDDLVVSLVVCLILIVNPILLPKIWRFVLARISEIAKATRGTD